MERERKKALTHGEKLVRQLHLGEPYKSSAYVEMYLFCVQNSEKHCSLRGK
jgi:hypothetical protein